MLTEILASVKSLIDNEQHLKGYIASGSVQTLILDQEMQTVIDESTSLGLNINIKFLDISSIGSLQTGYGSNEYIFTGKIDIEENVHINRTKPVYITGLQAQDWVLNALLNKHLPAVSGSELSVDLLSKITVLSSKLDDANKRDQTKTEFIKYTTEFSVNGLVESK